MTRSFVLSLFCLRVYLLVCIVPAIISTPSLGEINKHDRNKVTYTKEISDSIKNSEKSVISPHQSKDSKVNYIYIIEIISILD